MAFNRGSLRTQILGSDDHLMVQITTMPNPSAGGHTAIGVRIDVIEDGVAISIGQQEWLGIAASLGKTALLAWKNPLSLLGRLDDLAQDLENIQLVNKIWDTIEDVVKKADASFELSERLRRILCPYCRTANPTGEPHCIACGAPLGAVQPHTCQNCGFVVTNETICPNCKQPLPEQ
ncbi:MAG: zinc ribbon domain-containing protein [Anaerolineales bacterium]|nr:zinc ribbon domain-containing protein [Anaerolineales bacterium]